MVAIMFKRNNEQSIIDILFLYIQIISKSVISMCEMVKLFIGGYVLLSEKFG